MLRIVTTKKFEALLAELPDNVQNGWKLRCELAAVSPEHWLRYTKRLNGVEAHSLRLASAYRALFSLRTDADGSMVATFIWIGTHSAYDKLLKRAR